MDPKDYGILNYLLSLVGIPQYHGCAVNRCSVGSCAIYDLGSGLNDADFLKWIEGNSEQVIEAATIDGAGGLSRFFRITLPLLSPTIVYNVIMAIIASFQQLTVVMNLTNGGPLKSTYLYSLFVYENAFRRFQLGYAAASAWVMFVIILILTAVVMTISKKWTYYEV